MVASDYDEAFLGCHEWGKCGRDEPRRRRRAVDRRHDGRWWLYISSAALNIDKLPEISTGSPPGHAVAGASSACSGCSTSNSRTTCRAIAAVTGPRIWPSCAASCSASFAPTHPSEASKLEENQQAASSDLLDLLQLKWALTWTACGALDEAELIRMSSEASAPMRPKSRAARRQPRRNDRPTP
jgi:hypothetical protein